MLHLLKVKPVSRLTAKEAREKSVAYQDTVFPAKVASAVNSVLDMISRHSETGYRSVTFYPFTYLQLPRGEGVLLLREELKSLGYKVDVEWNMEENKPSFATVFHVSW